MQNFEIPDRVLKNITMNVDGIVIYCNNSNILNLLIESVLERNAEMCFRIVSSVEYTLPKKNKFKKFSSDKRYSLFINFNEDKMIDEENKTYNSFVEYNTDFRRHISNIFLRNYSDSAIKTGYWISSEKIEDIDILMLNTWGEICREMPRQSSRYDPTQEYFPDELLNFAKGFMMKILLYIKSSSSFIAEMLQHMETDENIALLIRSFTHSTVNQTANYQRIEYLGDRLLCGKFSWVMSEMFPADSETELSSFSLAYLSAYYLSFFSDDLYLTERLIRDPCVSECNKSKTDIFEALIGYIGTVVESKQNYCSGPVIHGLCHLMLTSCPFDRNTLRGKNKQQVIQILESNGFSKEDLTLEVNGNYIVTQCSEFLAQEFRSSVTSASKSRKLSSILSISYEFDPYKSLRDDALEEVWTLIHETFKVNGLVLNSGRKKLSSFFSLLKKNNKQFYTNLAIKVNKVLKGSDTPDISDKTELFNVLLKIGFSAAKHEKYACMYIIPGDTTEVGITKRGISHTILDENQKQYETYDNNPKLDLHPILSCVEFTGFCDPELKEIYSTPLNVAYYRCVEKYLNDS